MKTWALFGSLCIAGFALSVPASAGPVLLTGHDPDFHSAFGQPDGKQQLQVFLNFVTGGTYNSGTSKFLYVQSNLAPPAGFLDGEVGLTNIGLTAGTNYDAVDAAGLPSVNFANYSAIVVASSFGGMLTAAEINALVARSADIASFVNSGGGLAAFAECFPSSGVCDASNVTASTPLFGFVPVNVSSVPTTAPYHVTLFGAGLGLTDAIVSDCCTHNSFSLTGGLTVVDLDLNNIPTTLAGDVHITDGTFVPVVAEPAALAVLGLGLAAFGFLRRSRAT